MKRDVLLETVFDPERWQKAINKGWAKEINPNEIRQLCNESTRLQMYNEIVNGTYAIAPPYTAKIPKDKPGEFRTVYVNAPKDRILLSLINDALFELFPLMIHKNCLSYQKGVSCGNIVSNLSNRISLGEGIVGWKSDLSKYFDSVPIEYIDAAFRAVERKNGFSPIIKILYDYYHSDLYFNSELNEVAYKYQSLKQGCAVASWLADVVLYHIDDMLSKLKGIYLRYSDDTIFVGKDYEKAMEIMKEELGKMQMTINPKKIEYIDKYHWVKFLGFSIKGKDISLSSSGIKRFQKEIETATIKHPTIKYDVALRNVYRALYSGYNDFSWATRVLRVINVKHDVYVLNGFVMDCLRAILTNHRKVGGLGYRKEQKVGCIARGTGKNVKTNKQKVPVLKNYYTITCMQNALHAGHGAFDTLTREIL